MFGNLAKIFVTGSTRKSLSNLRRNIGYSRKMVDLHCEGVTLKKFVDTMNNFADTSLAASWDNVGLLIEPTRPKNIKHVMLTNDLTESVMQEAIDLSVDLIVSYHPPIFAPLKRITNDSWKERIAGKCMENKIALYSPHTSFDSIKGGVNDWLAGSFDIESSKPIEPGVNPENGMGRICQLKKTITASQAIDSVKLRTGLSRIRIALAVDQDKPINTVAVCAGSGSSVLKKIHADLYVTGEMLHHDILDAVHDNTHVILTNHSDSERGYLTKFSIILNERLNDTVKVSISKKDTDPLKTVLNYVYNCREYEKFNDS